ncbi:MAG: choice-of-anchor M domain-containing protein [Verrucomicrobia bacterium]|nr:choice-of-anchor M domain-containing protein [Verrucomicrobiota bacterium]
MRIDRTQAVICALALAAIITPAHADGAQVLNHGHYDLRFEFDPNTGWNYGIVNYATGEVLNPWTTFLQLGQSSERLVNNQLSFMGSPGSTFWVLPEQLESIGQEDEVLWLGLGAPNFPRNVFTGGAGNRGRLSMRLIDVSGSGIDAGGSFFMYQSAFPNPVVIFSFVNGTVGGSQMVNNIVTNFHAHFNWAFTQPGTYHVKFAISGELVPELGGTTITTHVMYSFLVDDVDTSAPFPFARPIGAGWYWQDATGFIYPANNHWVWLASQQSWHYFPAQQPLGLWSGTIEQDGQWHWLWQPR